MNITTAETKPAAPVWHDIIRYWTYAGNEIFLRSIEGDPTAFKIVIYTQDQGKKQFDTLDEAVAFVDARNQAA
jgi:hypothetical protein